MNEEKIISTIKMLAMSQGSYGRLYNNLMTVKKSDPDAYEAFIKEVSARCSDVVGLILYIEG